MSNEVKVITRAEYYASLGLSGSAIDRPDEPADEQFMKHCQKLVNGIEGFINFCKNDNSSTKFIL